MYSPKTPTDVLKNQAGIDGNERVSIEQAVEDIVKMLPERKKVEGFDLLHLKESLCGIYNSAIDEVHQLFKGGL